jgi:hypothetical protein
MHLTQARESRRWSSGYCSWLRIRELSLVFSSYRSYVSLVFMRSSSTAADSCHNEDGDSDFESSPPSTTVEQPTGEAEAKAAPAPSPPYHSITTATVFSEDASDEDARNPGASPCRPSGQSSVERPKRATRRASSGKEAGTSVDNKSRSPPSTRKSRGRASARLTGHRRKAYKELSESELEEAELDEVDEVDQVDEIDQTDTVYTDSSSESFSSESDASSFGSELEKTSKPKRGARSRQATTTRRARAAPNSRTGTEAAKPSTATRHIGQRLGTKAMAPLSSKSTDAQNTPAAVVQSRMPAGGFRVGLSRSALLAKRS